MNSLKINNLTILRENTLILDNINLDFKAGYIYGIISNDEESLITLVNILGGFESEDSGEIIYESKIFNNNSRIKKVGIARGNSKLINNLNVLENIFISCLRNYSIAGNINYRLLKKKAIDILKKLRTAISLKSKIKDLDRNQKLIIEIAKVLVKECILFIFLNITRSLSLRQYEAFTNILKDLKKQDKIILIFPETSEDIKILVDKLFVLNKGQIIEVEDFKHISNNKLNELLLSSEKIQFEHVFEPIYKAKMIIENKIGESEIDFHEIAKSVFMGYENFRRKFKKETGVSPNQYFIKLKMDKAKEMLLYTPLEIKEISYDLGFLDSCYFSRIFKEKEGITPTEFRKNRIDFYKK